MRGVAGDVMSGCEVLEEVAWFLDANVHPLLIADTIGRKPGSIYELARRHGDTHVREAFSRYQSSRPSRVEVAS